MKLQPGIIYVTVILNGDSFMPWTISVFLWIQNEILSHYNVSHESDHRGSSPSPISLRPWAVLHSVGVLTVARLEKIRECNTLDVSFGHVNNRIFSFSVQLNLSMSISSPHPPFPSPDRFIVINPPKLKLIKTCCWWLLPQRVFHKHYQYSPPKHFPRRFFLDRLE